MFLTEAEEADPKALITELIHAEKKYRFHAIWTGESLSAPGILRGNFFMNLRMDFKKSIPWVRLYPAPYADDVSQGINLFARLNFDKAFEPPPAGSILRSHLKIEQGILPDDAFYAFHALRYILGGLSIQKRLDVEGIEAQREAALRKKDKNLTGVSLMAWTELEKLKEKKDEEWW